MFKQHYYLSQKHTYTSMELERLPDITETKRQVELRKMETAT